MKLPIAALSLAVLTVSASASDLAYSRQPNSAEPDCAEDRSLAAHNAAMHHGMAMPGMLGGHMQMTPPRKVTVADRVRADQILDLLRKAIEPSQRGTCTCTCAFRRRASDPKRVDRIRSSVWLVQS